jgi:uncharacterized protein YdeI (YjbR/CyaY-like superfamily)
MPHGNGKHYTVVNKTLQKNCGASVGDQVEVSMVLDEDERTVAVPEDLQSALAQDSKAKQLFDDFAYSHRKEYIEWIISAKKPETRCKRIAKAMEMIVQRKRLK